MENNNNEIDNILNESPPAQETKKEDSKPIVPKKKKKKMNKKVLVYSALVIIAIIVGSMVLSSIDRKCECETNSCDLEVTNATQNFVNVIRNQVASNGYVEIKDSSGSMKLSPYLG